MWFLSILETFLLHLSSKQLLRHLKTVLHIRDQKSPHWDGGSGYQRKNVPTVCNSGIEINISLACLISCNTCFLPFSWGYLQAVDFRDFQISQRGTTFLSVGYFFRERDDNFLKSIQMWRRTICYWLLLLFYIMQNKESRKKNRETSPLRPQ